MGLLSKVMKMATEAKKDWKQIKLTLAPAVEQRFADAAHAARLPLAVFIRELLTTGQPPKPAPPASDELSLGAARLLKVCHGLISNLTQIEAHASRLGGPLGRLAGADGAVQKLSGHARALGMRVKAGELDKITIENILKGLEPAANYLNDQLTRPLNQGQAVSLDTWRQCLSATSEALK